MSDPISPVSLHCTITFPAAELARLPVPRLIGGAPMSRTFFPDQGGPAPSLRLWSPDSDDSPADAICGVSPHNRAQESATAHRTSNPVRAPESLFERVAASTQTGPVKLSPAESERVRQTVRLPEFYTEFMAPWRAEQIAAKQVKSGTAQKDRQAVNRWREWEIACPPKDWPDGEPWRGLPIGYLTGGYLDRFYAWAAGRYAPDTVESTRGHLAAILGFAVTIGVLAATPKASPLSCVAVGDDSLDEDLATVWTEGELNRLYRAMRGHPDLQAALVLACNVGPRAIDLFQLLWEKNLRLEQSPPKCLYRATKTGKVHGIPLPPVVLAHLDRLRRGHLLPPGGLLFPRLVSGACRDPERSHAARRRNKLVKRLMAEAGVPDHERPWQVCRATCCTRLNNVRRGVGSWVIGQGTDRAGTRLASEFYDNPTEEVVATILAAPQPEAFAEL